MTTTNKASLRAAKQMTVAEYLSGAIGLSGKTQRQITQEIGYDNPNVLTLFKQGKTKLPVNKVSAVARSLGVDPLNLLRLVMTEYMPDAWEVISALQADAIVSGEEHKMIDLSRSATGGLGVAMDDPKLVEDLQAAFEAHSKRLSGGMAAASANVKRGRIADS